MLRDPIIVLGAARSGTSMVAGLFAAHGVWTGECREPDEYNPKGYFENRAIKDNLLERYGHLKRKMDVADRHKTFRADVEAIIQGEGYEVGPWMVKHGALYWPAWHEFDPTFVYVYRNPEAILESGTHGNFIRTPERVMLCHGAMEWVCQCEGGIRVDSERLIAGDYAQVQRAFDVAGVPFVAELADEWIDADLWHHGEAA